MELEGCAIYKKEDGFCRSAWEVVREMPLVDFLFYLAFACFSVGEVLTTTAFLVLYPFLGAFARGMVLVAAPLLAMRIILLRQSAGQWLLTIVLLVFSALTLFYSGIQYPFWIFLFVAAGKGIDLKIIAKITLVVVTFMSVVTILSCYAGVLENYTLQETGERELRNSMGFLHPNRLGERLAEICIAYWYLNYNKHKARVIALCSVLMLYVNFVSNSRTACIVFALLIIGTLLYPFLSKFSKMSVLISGIVVAALVFASFYYMIEYDPNNSFMVSLNQTLSNRLSLMHGSFGYATPSLFGNDYSDAPVVGYTVSAGGDHHFVVDNAYSHLLLLYGIVPTALLFVLISLVYIKFFREESYPISLFGLTIILVVGFVENFTLDIQYNYFLLLISEVIFASNCDEGLVRWKVYE